MNNPHILGTERIGKLLVQYSIPAIIGMTITSLYNIIDSIFIGHGVGPMGIAGLAITFPLMNLVVAFCTMVSAGGSTISSIRLGQKDLDGATEVLGNTLMFCLVNAFIFGGISFIFLDDILRFFGASNDTLPYARDFMQVILLGTPVTYTMIGLNNIMRATGYPKKAMLTSMVTVVCNIILAPIFIFQFDWGIRGAATATVISQFIGMVWVVSHFLQKTSVVRLQRGFWKMKKRIISSILSIGMSPFLMNVTACVIVIIVNNSLQQYGGDMAIGAYGNVSLLAPKKRRISSRNINEMPPNMNALTRQNISVFPNTSVAPSRSFCPNRMDEMVEPPADTIVQKATTRFIRGKVMASPAMPIGPTP